MPQLSISGHWQLLEHGSFIACSTWLAFSDAVSAGSGLGSLVMQPKTKQSGMSIIIAFMKYPFLTMLELPQRVEAYIGHSIVRPHGNCKRQPVESSMRGTTASRFGRLLHSIPTPGSAAAPLQALCHSRSWWRALFCPFGEAVKFVFQAVHAAIGYS